MRAAFRIYSICVVRRDSWNWWVFGVHEAYKLTTFKEICVRFGVYILQATATRIPIVLVPTCSHLRFRHGHKKLLARFEFIWWCMRSRKMCSVTPMPIESMFMLWPLFCTKCRRSNVGSLLCRTKTVNERETPIRIMTNGLLTMKMLSGRCWWHTE